MGHHSLLPGEETSRPEDEAVTSQTDRIQALITEIDEVLGKSSPRLPWVMSGEVTQQRRLLDKVRQFLNTLKGSSPTTARGGTVPALNSSRPQRLAPPLQGQSPIHQQMLQAMYQDLRESLTDPLQLEIQTLQQQRQDLIFEIRQLDRQRQEAELTNQQANQEQWMAQLLKSLKDRLQDAIATQVTQSFTQLNAEVATYSPKPLSGSASELNRLEPASEALTQLTPQERLERLRWVQSQSDYLLLNLDTSIRLVFETLQKNLQSYQDSLSSSLENMHRLGQQGEVMFSTLISRLAEELGREASEYLQSKYGKPEAIAQVRPEPSQNLTPEARRTDKEPALPNRLEDPPTAVTPELQPPRSASLEAERKAIQEQLEAEIEADLNNLLLGLPDPLNEDQPNPETTIDLGLDLEENSSQSDQDAITEQIFDRLLTDADQTEDSEETYGFIPPEPLTPDLTEPDPELHNQLYNILFYSDDFTPEVEAPSDELTLDSEATDSSQLESTRLEELAQLESELEDFGEISSIPEEPVTETQEQSEDLFAFADTEPVTENLSQPQEQSEDLFAFADTESTQPEADLTPDSLNLESDEDETILLESTSVNASELTLEGFELDPEPSSTLETNDLDFTAVSTLEDFNLNSAEATETTLEPSSTPETDDSPLLENLVEDLFGGLEELTLPEVNTETAASEPIIPEADNKGVQTQSLEDWLFADSPQAATEPETALEPDPNPDLSLSNFAELFDGLEDVEVESIQNRDSLAETELNLVSPPTTNPENDDIFVPAAPDEDLLPSLAVGSEPNNGTEAKDDLNLWLDPETLEQLSEDLARLETNTKGSGEENGPKKSKGGQKASSGVTLGNFSELFGEEEETTDPPAPTSIHNEVDTQTLTLGNAFANFDDPSMTDSLSPNPAVDSTQLNLEGEKKNRV